MGGPEEKDLGDVEEEVSTPFITVNLCDYSDTKKIKVSSLTSKRGILYHTTAHDEFLPSFECLDILRTTCSWETGRCLHEGGVSPKWSD